MSGSANIGVAAVAVAMGLAGATAASAAAHSAAPHAGGKVPAGQACFADGPMVVCYPVGKRAPASLQCFTVAADQYECHKASSKVSTIPSGPPCMPSPMLPGMFVCGVPEPAPPPPPPNSTTMPPPS